MKMTSADAQETIENIKYVLSHDFFSQANKEEALQLLQMMAQD